jgi:hypothetical protein
MRILSALLFCIVHSALASLEKRGCARDNCLRAVEGTRSGSAAVAAASGDCSSFLLSTVTLPGQSSTYVSTLTTTVTVPNEVIKRSATGSTKAIPNYASACSGAARYSSACSCFGITGSVVTVTQVVCTPILFVQLASVVEMNG